MSPTHETGLDDGRGNHRRGSSCWLPRDETPKQSVRNQAQRLNKSIRLRNRNDYLSVIH